MSTKIVMGLETEYSFSYSGLNRDFLEDVPMPHVGGFLSNGARFYWDAGHPEYATPECADPWTLVAHAKAGDEIVSRWAKKQNNPILSLASAQVELGSNSMTTWGSHESYSANCPFSDAMSATLLPHLASRPALCGAGGFVRPRLKRPCGGFGSRSKVKFCTSPRLLAFRAESSVHTTGHRGLIGLKDEPHSSTIKRLHLICGDSVCSQTSLFLRFATTAMLVRIADEGHVPDVEMHGLSAIAAMRRWLYDPKRGPGSAYAMQRTLAKFARRFANRSWMPEWSGKAINIWMDSINIAENDANQAPRKFDWALRKALSRKLKGKNFSELQAFDAKFPIIDDGIFSQLEPELDHKMVSEGDIERAMTTPPRDTRANARGKAIARICRNRKAAYHHADWSSIQNERMTILRMPNPLRSDGGKARVRTGE